MNKLYFALILTLFYTTLYAQFEHATWYFGEKAGLDFSSGAPLGITDGQIETNEGCASISDDCGNLLFYTDGRRVYNRNHTVMLRGYGLAGESTSTQSAVIVPNPANSDQYYIFTIYSVTGFYYSLVDMTLDNGNGGLIEGQKNIQIPILQGQYKASEKVTVALTADCNGFWIITHAIDKFYSFKLTEEGFNTTPVITTIGMNVPLDTSASSIGYLKASPDSKKLAIAHKRVTDDGGALAVYDFDNVTGVVSNEKILYAPSPALPRAYYGAEFSPNGKILYATTEGFALYQYDLMSTNIPSTEKVIAVGGLFAMQLGVDRKIYVIPYESYFISVINEPNELLDPAAGTNPDYTSNSLYLQGAESRLGVPSFTIPYNYRGKIEINSVDNKCEGDNCFQVPLSFEFMGCPDASLVWDLGDGTTSTDVNPIHTYAAIGTYTILLTYTLAGHTYTTTTEITIHPLPVAQNAQLEACLDFDGNAEFDLTESYPQISGESDVDITFHELQSQAETGENDLPTTYTVPATTTIWIRIENENGCYVVRELELIVHPLPTFTIENPEVEICTGSSAELEITTDASNTVNWYLNQTDTTPIHTGNPFTTPNLNTNTTYWVEVISLEGCPSEREQIIVEIVSSPELTIATPVSVCYGENATLTAQTNASIVNWYDSETSTIPIFTGNPFETPELTSDTTYWVQATGGADCESERISVEIEIVPIPELTLPAPIEICSGETATITVAATNGTVNWYENELDVTPFFTGLTFSAEFTTTTTFWLEAVDGNCTSAREPITITINELPTIQANPMDPVCVDNPAELSIITNGTLVNWYENEFDTTPIFTGNPFITPNLNQNTIYYAEAISAEGCISERIPVEVEVTDQIIPVFDQIAPQCEGSTFTLPDQSINEIYGHWTPAINNTQTTTYTFIPDTGQCSAENQTMTVQIVDIPELILPEEDIISCIAQTVTITVSSTGETVNWYANELDITPIHSGNTYTVQLSVTTTFWVEAQTGNCKSERQPITVTVYPHPDMNLEEELLICEGDSFTYTAPDGFDVYEWRNESNQIISSTQEVTFTQEGIYTLTVMINGVPCNLSKNIEVKFSTPPTITDVKTTENSITIYATGGNPLEYSMNQVFWQSSPTFTNLQPGLFNVYVRDAKGCSTTARQTGILGVPSFISPNGDGYNDTWELRGLEVYPNTRLQIFDRYGKIFVDRIIEGSFQWDGKYNSQPLPSGSYWYILILENGEKLSGSISIRNY